MQAFPKGFSSSTSRRFAQALAASASEKVFAS
jgi:hypothetical protein